MVECEHCHAEIEGDMLHDYSAHLKKCPALTPVPEPKSPPKASPMMNYLCEIMQRQLRLAGVIDVATLVAWQEDVKLEPEEFIKKAKELAKSNKHLDISPLEDYFLATKSTIVQDDTPKKTKASMELVNAILPMLNASNGFITLKTDLPNTFEQTKNAIRTCLNEYVNINPNASPDELILPFIITKEKTFEGQVLANLDATKKSIALLIAYRDSNELVYQFFGEPKMNKRMCPYARYHNLFYVYKFLSDGNEDIVLLSPSPLELSNCRIHGMEASTYDFVKIGNMAKINVTQKIIFVHSQEPEINTLDEFGFWGATARIDSKEKFKRAFFGSYPHPQWFMDFLASWMFSGKLDHMPTHLSLLSPPSLGKTRMMENLAHVVNQKINESGTIKGLVPSFANGVPREGYFIKCKRFGFVDEFIHILAYSKGNHIVDSFDGGSSLLLKVLEHSEGEHSSAFGVITAKPRMWAMFVSNIKPHEHIRNFVELHGKLNAAFMSRILWYVYDQEHIDFINAQKNAVMKFNDGDMPAYSPELCALMDYLHNIILDIPHEEASKILERNRQFVPAELLTDIYDSRMIMHIYRMLDGYAKYKSIVERRGALVCTSQDIQDVDAMMERIIKSWSIGVDETKLPPRMRLSYLNSMQKEIYAVVEKNAGIDQYALEKMMGVTADQIARELCLRGLFREVKGLGGVTQWYVFDAPL